MSAGGNVFDSSELHDLVLALAGSGTTIADYLAVCERLWRDPKHRPWLVAALMRKASILTREPDEASIQFLGEKAYEAIELASLVKGPSKGEFIKLLPAVIQLMPEDVWTKPSDLWQTLLNTLVTEYGITQPDSLKQKSEAIDTNTTQLAALFADVIGSKWTKALEERLKAWKGDTNYSWLITIRRAKKLDALMRTDAKRRPMAGFVKISELLERLGDMSWRAKRRFLKSLDLRELAQTLSREKNIGHANDLISAIRKANHKTAIKLCKLMDFQEAANYVSRAKKVSEANDYLSTVSKLAPEGAKALCGVLYLHDLAHTISCSHDYKITSHFVLLIHQLDNDAGRNLCGQLNRRELARGLQKHKSNEASLFLKCINRINNDVGREIREILDSK